MSGKWYLDRERRRWERETGHSRKKEKPEKKHSSSKKNSEPISYNVNVILPKNMNEIDQESYLRGL